MYTFAKTFTVYLAFLHPIKAHSFAALKVAWLDCAEDSVLPPSTGRSPIILSALGKKGKNRVQPSRVGILCVILENEAFNGPRTIDITTIPPANHKHSNQAFRCFVQPQKRRRHA